MALDRTARGGRLPGVVGQLGAGRLQQDTELGDLLGRERRGLRHNLFDRGSDRRGSEVAAGGLQFGIVGGARPGQCGYAAGVVLDNGISQGSLH